MAPVAGEEFSRLGWRPGHGVVAPPTGRRPSLGRFLKRDTQVRAACVRPCARLECPRGPRVRARSDRAPGKGTRPKTCESSCRSWQRHCVGAGDPQQDPDVCRPDPLVARGKRPRARRFRPASSVVAGPGGIPAIECGGSMRANRWMGSLVVASVWGLGSAVGAQTPDSQPVPLSLEQNHAGGDSERRRRLALRAAGGRRAGDCHDRDERRDRAVRLPDALGSAARRARVLRDIRPQLQLRRFEGSCVRGTTIRGSCCSSTGIG